MSSASDVSLQNSLDAITARLKSGDDIEPPLTESTASQGEVEEFAEIIQSLHTTLTPLEPSPEFTMALRAELLDGERGLVASVRQMSARVQIAAIAALVAGFMLLIWRRLVGVESAQDIAEEAVATPL